MIRSRYGERERSPMMEFGESRTKQSFKESADINSVLARYARTGVWSRVERTPLFGDVSMVVDYFTALNRVMDARNDVRRLPAAAQEQYRANPGGWLQAVVGSTERGQLEELGLLEPLRVAEAPEAVPEPAEPA